MAGALGCGSGVAWAQPGSEAPPVIETAAAWEALVREFGGTPTATEPSRDAKMSFPISTEILEIPVIGGQRVKQGDVLIRARDAEVKTALDQQRALAESDLEVQGATAQLELADIRFQNLKDAGAFSKEEFDQRRIEAQTAAVQREQALFNKEQQRLRLAQLEAQYERYRLTAPFDGVVEEVQVDVGQGVTEQDKVLRVVNIDKMRLNPTPKTTETLTLRLAPGSRAWVLIDLPGKPALVEGKVIEVSPVADQVSLTRRVRVEIDNPRAWPPGTQAVVRFTEPAGERWAGFAVPGEPRTAGSRVERVIGASDGR
jgi:HlyD family secretion protein